MRKPRHHNLLANLLARRAKLEEHLHNIDGVSTPFANDLRQMLRLHLGEVRTRIEVIKSRSRVG